MGPYNMATGSGNLGPHSAEAQLKGSQSTGVERPATTDRGTTSREPIELEQAFNGAYRSYGINGRPRMDVETCLHRIRGDLIDLIR